ncbi:MAG: HEAT repeat domain-containing protein [Acidobacteria bacterium]|nr:HEAT repeat domain-containing protein [Acidobacteriota bacterium]
MNKNISVQCNDVERLAVFYACGELTPEERLAIEEHAATCAACAASLAREQQLIAAVVARQAPEPSATLVAQCRGDLGDALDDAAQHGWRQRMLAWLRPGAWFTVRPAWSAALLIILGVALGLTLPRWLENRETLSPEALNASAMVVRPESTLSGQDLRNVSSISFVPGAGADQSGVQVYYVGEESRVRTGTPDDSDVRRALLYVLQNNLQFDSGLRLDSLEALRSRSGDADVRGAFCFAARNDRNPGVRLKALEALRGFEQEAAVRKKFMDALLRDDNPGVRIEAINALRAMADRPALAGAADAELLKVLRDRMQNDSNSYVRLQSAAAVRQLGTRAQY